MGRLTNFPDRIVILVDQAHSWSRRFTFLSPKSQWNFDSVYLPNHLCDFDGATRVVSLLTYFAKSIWVITTIAFVVLKVHDQKLFLCGFGVQKLSATIGWRRSTLGSCPSTHEDLHLCATRGVTKEWWGWLSVYLPKYVWKRLTSGVDYRLQNQISKHNSKKFIKKSTSLCCAVLFWLVFRWHFGGTNWIRFLKWTRWGEC